MDAGAVGSPLATVIVEHTHTTQVMAARSSSIRTPTLAAPVEPQRSGATTQADFEARWKPRPRASACSENALRTRMHHKYAIEAAWGGIYSHTATPSPLWAAGRHPGIGFGDGRKRKGWKL